MQTNAVNAIVFLVWIASLVLLFRAIWAANELPRRMPGMWPNVFKLLTVTEAGGYFCIAVIAPLAGSHWALWGMAMVIVSGGAVCAVGALRRYAILTMQRLDGAFGVDL